MTAREFYKQKYGYEPQRGETFSIEAALEFADEHAAEQVRGEKPQAPQCPICGSYRLKCESGHAWNVPGVTD